MFISLGKRLTELRDRYSHGMQASLDFLKDLLQLARDTVAAEKQAEEVPPEEKGKAALTELFESIKDSETPIMVERLVNEIDSVVRAIRFSGWQDTREGDREVRQALRKILYVKFQIRDEDIYSKAYAYIREYY